MVAALRARLRLLRRPGDGVRLGPHALRGSGRRRPYILGSAIPLGVAFYFLFTPPAAADPVAAQGALLLYMVALYTLTYVIWTIGAIPYYGLGAELTDDYHERTRVIAVREAFSLAGLLVATLLPAYLIDLYGGRAGYSFMGGILGAGVARLPARLGRVHRGARRVPRAAALARPLRGLARDAPQPALPPAALGVRARGDRGRGAGDARHLRRGVRDRDAALVDRVDPELDADVVVLPARLLPRGRALAAALERAREAARQARHLGRRDRARDGDERRLLLAPPGQRRALHG